MGGMVALRLRDQRQTDGREPLCPRNENAFIFLHLMGLFSHFRIHREAPETSCGTRWGAATLSVAYISVSYFADREKFGGPRSAEFLLSRAGSDARGFRALAGALAENPIYAAASRSNPCRLFPTRTDICRSDLASSTSL